MTCMNDAFTTQIRSTKNQRDFSNMTTKITNKKIERQYNNGYGSVNNTQ